MDKIKELLARCDVDDKFLVAEMLRNAADYVRSVVVMETAASNVEGLDADEFREARQSTDRARTYAHDAFITSVNVVNRLCDFYGVEKVYLGGSERREYGDFAMEIVSKIFENRN